MRTLWLASAVFLCIATPCVAQDDPGVSEVVVTASPLGGDPDRFATIVSAVRESEIQAHGGGNLADALRDVPGVAATTFAAGASRPVIRGMDANRVKVLEGGVSSFDVSDIGPDHGVPVDPLATRRIEVVRGAATLRYGSQAIGGVVNALDDRIPTRVPERLAEVQLLAAGGTVAGAGEGAAHLDGGRGRFAYHADAYGHRASDYDTPLGVQDNSFFQGQGYSLGGSYFLGQDGGRTGAALVRYRSRYGIPSGDTFIRMRQTKLLSGSSFKVAAGPLQTINLDIGHADYRHDEIDPAGPSIEATFKNREGEGRLEALFGQTGVLSASALGLQIGDRRFEALGAGADYLSPSHTRTAAGFVFAEAPAGPLSLQGAVRGETVRIEGTPASGVATRRRFTPISASLGGSVEATEGLRFGLTFASAARAPAVTELFARGPHDGPLTFETGDPDLKVERANSAEASVRLKRGRATLEASGWTALFDGYIFGQLTGRTCSEAGLCSFGGPGDLKELNYAQGRARFTGLEVKAGVPLASGLKLELLGDTVRARFLNGAGDVPRIQPSRLGAGLQWQSERLDAGFTVMRVGAQDHPGALETRTPGYTTLDGQIMWRPPGMTDLRISIVGHNLTNAEVRNAVALNRDLVVQPGRDLRLVLVSNF